VETVYPEGGRRDERAKCIPLPSSIPCPKAHTFAGRAAAALDLLPLWRPAFQRISNRADELYGRRLPRAVYLFWYKLWADALFVGDDAQFQTRADVVALARLIWELDQREDGYYGRALDIAPQKCVLRPGLVAKRCDPEHPREIVHVMDEQLFAQESGCGLLDEGGVELPVADFLATFQVLLTDEPPPESRGEFLRTVSYDDFWSQGGGPIYAEREVHGLFDATVRLVRADRRELYRLPKIAPGLPTRSRFLLSWRNRVWELCQNALFACNCKFGANARLDDLSTGSTFRDVAELLVIVGNEIEKCGVAVVTAGDQQEKAPPAEQQPDDARAENHFCPYAIEKDLVGKSWLVYVLDDATPEKRRRIPLSPDQAEVMGMLITAKVGVQHATLKAKKPQYSTYISAVKTKLRKALIPDHIHTSGTSAQGRGGMYSIRLELCPKYLKHSELSQTSSDSSASQPAA
jgi:hypothetical protein